MRVITPYFKAARLLVILVNPHCTFYAYTFVILPMGTSNNHCNGFQFCPIHNYNGAARINRSHVNTNKLLPKPTTFTMSKPQRYNIPVQTPTIDNIYLFTKQNLSKQNKQTETFIIHIRNCRMTTKLTQAH